MEPGPPGTDRTQAIVEAGDRIAAGLRRSIGLPGEAAPANGYDTERHAERGTPTLVIDGSLLALVTPERLAELDGPDALVAEFAAAASRLELDYG